MPPVRLLALTVYGYLAPVLRKPLRPQLHRYYHHHHHRHGLSPWTSPARNSVASAIRGLHLPPPFSRMASTTHHNDGDGSVALACNRAGKEAEAVVELDLDTAADVYRYLRGHWELEKSIDYKVGGMAGSWRGVASFSPPLPLPPPPQQQQQQQQQQQEQQRQQQQQQHQQQHEAAAAAAAAAVAAADGEQIDPSLLLRYLEQGTFRINGLGAGFEAGQRLVYDCGNSSGRVRVHFVDDPKQPDALRFFHELDFRRPGTDTAAAAAAAGCSSGGGGKAAAAVDIGTRRPRAEFEHLCVRDMYRGQVEVVGPDEFKTRRVFDRDFVARNLRVLGVFG
ncbi:unnamed protein product [Laminaria digitata]